MGGTWSTLTRADDRKPLLSKSILEVQGYTFGDASENTIRNINPIIGSTIQFFDSTRYFKYLLDFLFGTRFTMTYTPTAQRSEQAS